jgi:DNA-binding transcriptional MerR regulator
MDHAVNVVGPLSIAQTAEVTGVGAHALRYYERNDLLRVPRNANGHRRYGPDEVAAIRFITQLRKTGIPIQTIRDYADMVRSGSDTANARLQLLEEHQTRVNKNLDEQQAHLEAIVRKIAAYHAQPPSGRHVDEKTSPADDA